MPLPRIILTLALLLAAATGTAHSQSLRTVALTDQRAPGTPNGELFDIFSLGPSLNAAGRVAFWADSNPTPAIREGLWSEGNGTLQLIARQGDQVPGLQDGARYDSLGAPNLNAAGDVAFSMWLLGNGQNNRGWMVGNENALRVGLLRGNPAPGTPAGVQFTSNGTIDLRRPPVLNAQGHIAFIAGLTGPDVSQQNDSGLWAENASGLQLVVRQGDTPPGFPAEPPLFSIFSPAFNSAGQVVFLADGDAWFGTPGDLQRLAAIGQQALGTLSGMNYTFIDVPTINARGQIAFMGVAGDGTNALAGIWVGTENDLQLVVRHDDAAPGMPSGVTVGGMSNLAYVMNAAGEVAFASTMAGTGIDSTNDGAIMSQGFGSLAIVAREGDPAPGTPAGILFNELTSRPSLNARGQVALAGTLRGPGITTANDQGLWALDRAGNLRLIVREGDPLEVARGDFRTVRSFEIGPTSGNEDGLRSFFNDAGQLAFKATFTDTTQGIFVSNLATVPEPAAAALFAFAGITLMSAVRGGRSRRR